MTESPENIFNSTLLCIQMTVLPYTHYYLTIYVGIQRRTWITNALRIGIQVLFFHHLHSTDRAYGITVATVNAHVLMDDIAITVARDGLRRTIHGASSTTHTGVFNMKVHRQAS